VTQNGTDPEVAYNSTELGDAVRELNTLLPGIESSQVREHATATLERVQYLSRDTELRADCASALVGLRTKRAISPSQVGVATALRSTSAEALK
jgi:hypothetical protein